MLRAYVEEIEIPVVTGHKGLLSYLSEAVLKHLGRDVMPVRFVISETTQTHYKCELGVLTGLDNYRQQNSDSIFNFSQRETENTSVFNTVLLVPTGIGCTIGGHAGDANPVSKLLASVSDKLITHPNVVNASDINELPENALFVEGSVLTRLMLGKCGLQPVRANRLLVVIDEHSDEVFTHAAINSVSAARASFGLDCPSVVRLSPSVHVCSEYASSGRAVGIIERLEGLLQILDDYRGEYDALALSTQIKVPENMHVDYYQERGNIINPWGGVEALFTHTLSMLYDIPSAHSPMYTSQADMETELGLGVVDPRMAAEIISIGFFMCVLKGLQRSPRIIKDQNLGNQQGVITVSDISCLVIPDGCLGLPTLAALEQGIPVIAVRENRNIMRNDLAIFPWAPGQLHIVENYWEAVGVIAAIKEGITPESVRRPLLDTTQIKRNKTTN